MMNVTQLARSCGVSRGTILHYEAIGLLRKASRSGANYRCYGDDDLQRMRRICSLRNAGLKLEDIRELLDGAHDDGARVLERRFAEIDREIAVLRAHQYAIIGLLKSDRRTEDMTKEKWVEIMKATGFSEEDMRRWHQQFEKAAPDDHQEFLEYLKIGAEEIAHIRTWSRQS